MTWKGILLAGGGGSRLHPLTRVASKQLQPIYNKPMIYYPLTTLMLVGVREILIITTPTERPRFEALLGDGASWGLSLTYSTQAQPNGIAEALLVGEDFIGDDSVLLMLGDNVLYGPYDPLRHALASHDGGATIFGYQVRDPRAYGVVELDGQGRPVSIEEKPAEPRSSWAVPGFYLYGPSVAERARRLQPSARGELEITDLHRGYLHDGRLTVVPLGRGMAWFDTGTAEALLDAANFVRALEERQGLSIGCPEEAAYRAGLIDLEGLEASFADLPACGYREYLERLVAELRR